MNVGDSSGWLEYYADGPDAHLFAELVQGIDRLIVPTITIFEVFKRFLQQRGRETAKVAVAHMERGNVVALDQELALNAAELGLELKLPMADSIILATARRHRATLWTLDKDFEGIEGVRYFAKKRGEGRGVRDEG